MNVNGKNVLAKIVNRSSDDQGRANEGKMMRLINLLINGLKLFNSVVHHFQLSTELSKNLLQKLLIIISRDRWVA
jgi:hypothetical protein